MVSGSVSDIDLYSNRERLENLEFQDPQGSQDQLWVVIFIDYCIYHLKSDGAFHDLFWKSEIPTSYLKRYLNNRVIQMIFKHQ